jgi:PAS domain S-box-containing protein
MTEKQTYEEMKQRINTLEKERKQIDEALKESEDRLKSFYNAAFEGIAISEQGKIIDFNRQFSVLFGYERDELIGKKVMDLVPEEDRELVLNNIRSGFDKPYEHKALKKDGSVIFIEVHGQQIQFQGHPARATAVHDLTETKLAEETMRESEDRYRSLFNNSHSVMLVIDPDSGNIVDANPAAISYYGWSYSALTTKKISDINLLSQEQVFQEMKKAKAEERSHFNFQHQLSSGDIRDVEAYSGPIKIHGKNLLYSIIHDVTDRKHAEKEREKLIAELQEAVKEIKTLRGILPLCSFCKKIRDDTGYWEQVDVYIHKHLQADISHGICPECAKEHYPDLDIYE